MKHPDCATSGRYQGLAQHADKILLLLAMICTPSAAQINAPNQVFDIAKDVDFADYKKIVNKYIIKRQIQKSTQVCLLGKMTTDSSKLAWVIWSPGQEILLYEQGETDLQLSRRKLDLKKDVVENDAAINGSTYLVTRDWVAQLKKECQQYGITWRIEKNRR